MARISKLEDLEIYKNSLLLAKEVFDLCKSKQLVREFSLCDQVKRAAVSVSANMSEGFGRGTKKDFAKFLSIALGSCNEVYTLLDIIRLNFPSLRLDDLREGYNILGKRIYTFRSKLV